MLSGNVGIDVAAEAAGKTTRTLLHQLQAHGLSIGFALATAGVLVFPLIAVCAGRDVTTSEVFGMAPDPTVFATLGILVFAAPSARVALLPIPLAWCALSGATLWTRGSPEWWLLLAAAVLSIAAAIRQRHGA